MSKNMEVKHSDSSMRAFEEYIDQATAPGKDRKIPGCVVVVVDKNGIVYEHTSGTQSVDPASPLVNKPMKLDTTMWIASCTKLMTAISVLQCVEKGLLDLDADVSELLPEYKDAQVITGFDDDGAPTYRPTKGKMTVRMLLSHQSGMGYVFLSPLLTQLEQYNAAKGLVDPQKANPTLHESYFRPLLFDPGTAWNYSAGVDFAGLMVARATGITLNTYMQTNIWTPLGLQHTSFRLQSRPDILALRADMTARIPGGTLVPSPTRYHPEDAPDDGGGGGAYSNTEDYVRILSALLRNDGTLLKPESIDVLFSSALSPAVTESLHFVLYGAYPGNEKGELGAALGSMMPAEMRPTFGIGGLVVQEDAPGRRKKGSLAWSGLPNLCWMVDRTSGIALMYSSQLLPPGDRESLEAWKRFEEAVYAARLEASREGQKL